MPESHDAFLCVLPKFERANPRLRLGEVWQILRDRICVEVKGIRVRATYIGDHQITASTSKSYVTPAVFSPTGSE